MPTTTIIHKFGHNASVAQTYVPISAGGVWQTPQVSGATPLRVKAGGSPIDTSTGNGAREITLIGLDQEGREITETVATNGISASDPTTKSFLRLYRMYVSASGTYATVTTGSHSAPIVIENAAGTADWGTVTFNDIPASQSQIGGYSVPFGKKAKILQIEVSGDSSKLVSVLFFQRANILETTPPYSANRLVQEFIDVSGVVIKNFPKPLGVFPALTDFGFMGKVAVGTAGISATAIIELEG